MTGISSFMKKVRGNKSVDLSKPKEEGTDSTNRQTTSFTNFLPQRTKSTTYARGNSGLPPALPLKQTYVQREKDLEWKRSLKPSKGMNTDIAACTNLLRQMYSLELETWAMENDAPEELHERQKSLRKARALYDEINKIVHRWELMDVDWTDEEFECIQSICIALERSKGSKEANRRTNGIDAGSTRTRSTRGYVPEIDGDSLKELGQHTREHSILDSYYGPK